MKNLYRISVSVGAQCSSGIGLLQPPVGSSTEAEANPALGYRVFGRGMSHSYCRSSSITCDNLHRRIKDWQDLKERDTDGTDYFVTKTEETARVSVSDLINTKTFLLEVQPEEPMPFKKHRRLSLGCKKKQSLIAHSCKPSLHLSQ